MRIRAVIIPFFAGFGIRIGTREYQKNASIPNPDSDPDSDPALYSELELKNVKKHPNSESGFGSSSGIITALVSLEETTAVIRHSPHEEDGRRRNLKKGAIHLHVKKMRSIKIQPILCPMGPMSAPDCLEDRYLNEDEVGSYKMEMPPRLPQLQSEEPDPTKPAPTTAPTSIPDKMG